MGIVKIKQLKKRHSPWAESRYFMKVKKFKNGNINILSSFEELKGNSWSGAVDTLNRIEELELENNFMEILEEVFCVETPTETEVNDFIWFERDTINDMLCRNTVDLFQDEEETV